MDLTTKTESSITMLDASFTHDKHDTKELGWKLFTLQLVRIIAIWTTRLATIAATMWAFKLLLERTTH